MGGDRLTIGDLARATATKVVTVRYYERIGLLPAPARTAGNYRAYGPDHLNRLSFVRRARDLGFTVDGIADLLALWRDRSRRSAEVKALASGHVAALRRRILELEGMVDTLSHLAECCQGDARPECPILADLAGAGPAEAPPAAAPAARFGKAGSRPRRRAPPPAAP